MEIPVYVIAGFLDGGKTTFLKPMLASDDFTGDDRTLFLCCEEGEEEYDLAELRRHNVVMETVESEGQLTTAQFKAWEKKYRPEQVVVEYNGMWSLAELEQKLPTNWALYQLVTLVDATTFDLYVKNMGAVMMEKLMGADMIILNRCTPELAQSLRKRNLKMVNRAAEIYLEFTDGSDEVYDDGTTPPFDLSGDVLELDDEDFGVWYVDCMDHLDRYEGKTVRFKGMVAKSDQFPKGSFVAGRFAMVCCEQDKTFLGMICQDTDPDQFNTRDWVQVTATVRREYVKLYDGDGPVLHTTDVVQTTAPEEELVSF
jgi:uncharacterized repeat protein (TIGR03943 family)